MRAACPPIGPKLGYYVLEGLNALATTWYFYYLYFFTEKTFGFTKVQNLWLAAGLGLAYGISCTVGGRVAQRRGYFPALRFGWALMAAAILAGAWTQGLPAHLGLMLLATFGMAFTWPSLEALVSEGEARRPLQRNLGVYNLVWGGAGAVAYFSGGAMVKALGFRSIFLVPATIHLLQIAMTFALKPPARHMPVEDEDAEFTAEHEREMKRSPVSPKRFLNMAWLANPFAYLAINTVVAVIPALAARLGLSVAAAGVFCSVWFFVRTAGFGLLWLWPGWHYRFRWLVWAYVVMTASFVVLLVVPNLWVLLAAQVVFGLSLALIYYSSLYYSMDVGDTKGEHGGFHEAMIGLGSGIGPAIGAMGAHFFPNVAGAGAGAVGALLAVGLAGLLWLRWKK